MDEELSKQIALDRIHKLAKTLRQCAVTVQQSATIRRLLLCYLRDVGELTDSLFKSDGENSRSIISELSKIETEFSRIFLKVREDGEDAVTQDNEIEYTDNNAVHETIVDGSLRISRTSMLTSVVDEIRRVEKTYSFQQTLWREKRQVSKLLGSSIEQCT
jgi:hypothetical protein